MKLAKDCLDIGLMTEDAEMIDFFAEEVGLGAPERLPVSRDMTQHRFDVAGSVVKVNVLPSLDTSERSGYRGIRIARAGLERPVQLAGPDGVRVELVPTGDRGVEQLGIELEVPNLGAAQEYFGAALGWETGASADGAVQVRLGRSVVILSESSEAPAAVKMPVVGWNYITVQIHSCDDEVVKLVDRGVRVAAPARTLGDVARFAMVADDWGNLLEISQRFSLVGHPDGAAVTS